MFQLPDVLCFAQVGIVSKDKTLNDLVEDFINNPICDENDLYGIVSEIQKAGDLSQGLRVMNFATHHFPNSYYAHYMRGFYNRNLERYEDAISDYTTAISIEPRFAGAYLDRGECMKALNRNNDAAFDFNKAIEESEKLLAAGLQYQGIEFAKPFALVGIGKYNEVFDWISNYNGKDYYDIACLYSKMKDLDKTLVYLRKALEDGYPNVNFIKVDNCMSWLKNNDKFIRLIEEYHQ